MYNREILEALYECADPEMTLTRKAVLIYFAKFAQPDGSGIHPGVTLASLQLNCNEKTIDRALSWAISSGYFLADGKLRYVNKYKISRTKLGLPATPPKPKIRAKTVLEPIPEKPEENISNGRNEHKPPEKTGQENAEDARIWRYKAAVFQYYGALEKKKFANTQEMETYQWARDQLMQLGISEERLMREYENEKVGVSR